MKAAFVVENYVDSLFSEYNIIIMATITKIPSKIKLIYVSDYESVSQEMFADYWIIIPSENEHVRLITTLGNLVEKQNLFNNFPSMNIKVVIDGLIEGIPTKALDKVSDLIGVDQNTLVETLGLQANQLQNDRLPLFVSEKILRLSVLFQIAVDVLDDFQFAQRWFTRPKRPLGGNTPLEFAKTDVGAREVEDVIGRIKYGVYS